MPMGIFRQKTGREARINGDAGLSSVKSLGATIGDAAEPASFDGDGDGLRTGRDGKDNIPVGPKKIVDELQKLWGAVRDKQLAKDEDRVSKAAFRLKQRRTPRSANDIHELIKGAKDDLDAKDTRRAVRQWAEAIYNIDGLGDNEEYTARLFKDGGVEIIADDLIAATQEDIEGWGPHIAVNGEIVDKNGKRVALFDRKIFLDGSNSKGEPHVYNDQFQIMDRANRGKGIGADFTIATEAMYGKIGLDKMHLQAALEDGVYTWSRAGYNFKDDEERSDFAKLLERKYQTMLREAGSKEKLIAGGFKTTVGRRIVDDNHDFAMPSPLFDSPEQLELFLKFLGRVKSAPLGSDREIHPSAFTMFGAFSRQIMRGMSFEMVKDVRRIDSPKGLTLGGLDTLFQRV